MGFLLHCIQCVNASCQATRTTKLIFLASCSEWLIPEGDVYFCCPLYKEIKRAKVGSRVGPLQLMGDSGCVAQGHFGNADERCQSMEAVLPVEWVSTTWAVINCTISRYCRLQRPQTQTEMTQPLSNFSHLNWMYVWVHSHPLEVITWQIFELNWQFTPTIVSLMSKMCLSVRIAHNETNPGAFNTSSTQLFLFCIVFICYHLVRSRKPELVLTVLSFWVSKIMTHLCPRDDLPNSAPSLKPPQSSHLAVRPTRS